jgi:hypothetical protein
MQIDIDTTSFIVYRSTSKFNLLQRYRLNILSAILLVFIGIFFVWFFTKIFNGINISKIIGWALFFLVFSVWIFIGYLFHLLLNGRLKVIGRITFAFNGIELMDFENRLITYDELIYLSSDYERPENQLQKHPPAKTYLIKIVTQDEDRYSFVVSRLSSHPIDRIDLVDLLQKIRQQNHHLYKALRGVKRDFVES